MKMKMKMKMKKNRPYLSTLLQMTNSHKIPIRPHGKFVLAYIHRKGVTDSLALRPAISPLQNLQHPITQMLLCGTTEMNGQFLGQNFNLLDRLPVTAYDPTLVALSCSLSPVRNNKNA